VPISELVTKLSSQSGIKYLVLDGIITQRLIEGAKLAGINCLIGHRDYYWTLLQNYFYLRCMSQNWLMMIQ